jgi:SlyX protein
MTETARLNDLESRITHLERGLQDVSDVLVRQQKELDRAVERTKNLAERLAAVQDEAQAPSGGEETPPHY